MANVIDLCFTIVKQLCKKVLGKNIQPTYVIYIAFVYIGATSALEVVWAFGDLALGLMTVPNLIAVVLLMPKIVELSKDYFQRMKEKDAETKKIETT